MSELSELNTKKLIKFSFNSSKHSKQTGRERTKTGQKSH